MEESQSRRLQRVKRELAAEKAKEDQGTGGGGGGGAYIPKPRLGHEEYDIYKKDHNGGIEPPKKK